MFGLLLNFDISIAQASNKRTAVQQLNPAPTKSLSITGSEEKEFFGFMQKILEFPKTLLHFLL